MNKNIYVLMIAGLFLASCSGGGDSTTTPSTTPAPAATAATGVALAVSGKSLDFSWTAGSNVDHYRISVNPDGASGFTVETNASNIASSATSFSLEIPVHKTNWLAAQYIIEACNADESTCVASPNQTLALIDSVAATVYAKASNTGANDYFGWSVALSDDANTLAVGAYGEDSATTGVNGNQLDNTAGGSGAAYVFSRTGNTWTQQAYIKASNTGANDFFGHSVALNGNGNTLAVGTYREGSNATGVGGNQLDNAATFAGAAYVFTRSGTVWSQQAYIKASNTETLDSFGHSVALSGDGNTLVVGAYGEDSNATGVGGNQLDNTAGGSGAAYVFSRTGNTWTQQAYIKASNTGAGDNFGRSVALNSDGSTLAVGANFEGSNAVGVGGSQLSNASFKAGAVYVFSRTGTVWTQQAYIKASNTGVQDYFGESVALSDDGNTLAVGAYRESSVATGVGGNQLDNTATQSGAVYVFSRTAIAWTQQAYIKSSNTEAGDWFGRLVALSSDGNTLAVTGYGEDSSSTGVNSNGLDNTALTSGAAYVFSRTGNVWAQQAYVKAPNAEAAELFGSSIALNADGNTLAIGAQNEDSVATGVGGNQADNTASAAGAVYLY